MNKSNNIGAFERFTGQYARNIGKQPRATMNRSGGLFLNYAACKTYSILDYSYCVLFYVPESGMVGLLFTNDKDEPGARTFTHMENHARVSIKSMLNHYDLEATKKHYTISVGDGGLLVLEAQND